MANSYRTSGKTNTQPRVTLMSRRLSAAAELVELVAAGVQDYFAVSDFSVRDTILIGIFDRVTS
jgi:hypothetical protein